MTHDLACALHVHSLHSDGTGTIGEIAAAAKQARADVVVVTDHDTLDGRGEAGWHDGVLVAVGVEVTPMHGSHLLAFGTDEVPGHVGRTSAQAVAAVRDAGPGAAAFAAHPFSTGAALPGRAGAAAPFGDLRAPLHGIEVWSLVSDTVATLRSPREALRFLRDPDAVLTGPPAANLAAWDRMNATRRVAGIAGLDAHQFRLRGRTAMTYARTFSLLRTHVLLPERPADERPVLEALREGRCYMARDSLADATGFRFDGGEDRSDLSMGAEAALPANGAHLRIMSPRPARLTLLRDGTPVATSEGTRLEHHADRAGVFRAEAHLHHAGAWRTWALTNPIRLR